MSNEPQIKALLEELPRHIAAGREERVEQIKAELAALGFTRTDGASDVMETAVDAGPAPAAQPVPDEPSDPALAADVAAVNEAEAAANPGTT